ncbi:MAG: FtsQ-type POTRA domain-containing protein [Anaerolineae bacterium]|nr:FtsQ-type POTRA domain-containing protein [Anaerolineae bacterium]MDW8101869.1 FtsQ-type POTRA domain-containing protein [Anaerolineae bacterium]
MRRAPRSVRRRQRRHFLYRNVIRPIALAPARLKAFSPHRWAAVGIILSIMAFFFYSGLAWEFYDYPVIIRGGKVVTSDVVKALCGLEYYHIFFVDSDQCQRKLEGITEVKRAYVSVHFPPKVVVTVEEREPVMELISGGRSFLVDREGVIMENRVGPTGLFRLVDDSGGPVRPGDRLSWVVLKVALKLKELGVEREGELHYHPNEGFILMARAGYPVYLGLDLSLMPLRLEAFRYTLEHLEAEGIRPVYIDVRAPDAPVYLR